MTPTRFVPCVLAVGTLLFASTGSGATTWQWRDAQGRMVFSDRAPPADVRASQILRSPSGGSTPAASPRTSSASPSASPADPGAARSTPNAPPGAAPASSWVERERAFRQRLAEREADTAKAREESDRAATAKRACDEAQRAIRTLESGMRVVMLNARGEPEPLDDAQRAQRLKNARADSARLCTDR